MKSIALSALTISAMLFGCASQPLDEALQPSAVKVAQQRGATELGCPAATTEVIRQRIIEEAQTTGWGSESPNRAEYVVGVSGCDKRTTYLVACNKFHSACEAGPMPTPKGAPRQLADDLQPDAIKAAQQRASKEFACPTPTAQVTRQQTVEEEQTTGWYEPPHRAVYAVKVTGCEKQTAYLVECDSKKRCATGALQPTSAGPQQLADKLQPNAVRTAQERGSTELECPAATAEVNRKTTVEEAQTTGWYEPPHRALYTVTVAGCGKQTTYVVACNDKDKRCTAGKPQ
jgi:hypothetical protein